MTDPVDLLVVGAGPAGLALALQAHAHGASVRVVERRPQLDRPSRALIVHPRTLEVLRPLGVTNALLARADRSPKVELHLGRRVIPAHFGQLGLLGTAFPHPVLLRQSDLETVLSAALSDRGVQIVRGAELVGIEQAAQECRALVVSGGISTWVGCRFLAGCDGANSTVRTLAGIGWRGGSYAQEVLLADVELDSELTPGAGHVVVRRAGLLFLFAAGDRSTWRLMATRSACSHGGGLGEFGPPVPVEELRAVLVDTGLASSIRTVGWSARVRTFTFTGSPGWPGTGVMIVRPDGYVGFRAAVADRGQIAGWLGMITDHWPAGSGTAGDVGPRRCDATIDRPRRLQQAGTSLWCYVFFADTANRACIRADEGPSAVPPALRWTQHRNSRGRRSMANANNRRAVQRDVLPRAGFEHWCRPRRHGGGAGNGHSCRSGRGRWHRCRSWANCWSN